MGVSAALRRFMSEQHVCRSKGLSCAEFMGRAPNVVVLPVLLGGWVDPYGYS